MSAVAGIFLIWLAFGLLGSGLAWCAGEKPYLVWGFGFATAFGFATGLFAAGVALLGMS